MWHFGVDSSIEYTGERFSASWKVAQNALIAVYSKQWKDGKYRIRGERQEYPGKPKRMFGEYVNARKFHNMTKELLIKASLYNMFVAMKM
jgi:hypothetical protein